MAVLASCHRFDGEPMQRPTLPLINGSRPARGKRHLAGWSLGLFLLQSSTAMAINPPAVQTYFVPMPESQVFNTLFTLTNTGCSNTISDEIETFISMAVVAEDTRIYYDQWEDGAYDLNIANPANVYSATNPAGTQIWGDGDPSNGAPPGFPADLLNAGDIIILDNAVDQTDPLAIDFDGRDKFAASKTIAASRSAWATTPGTVFADAVELYDTNLWGTAFAVPVGTDVPYNSLFEYTGAAIMAAEPDTVLSIDADADGIVESTVTLGAGESHQINGDLKTGATVTSTKPVQMQMMTGDFCANWETRWFSLLDTTQWFDAYWTPVTTTQAANPAGVFLYNPNATPIVIFAETTGGTTPITIPAGENAKFPMPSGSGAKFVSQGGEDFYALSVMDSNGGVAYDWGFALTPQDSLTQQILVGWGPGQDPTQLPLTQNGSPVWITPVGGDNVLVCVDYNGDGGSETDLYGNTYDVDYTLDQLASQTLYDPDGDQTGMVVYVCDSTSIVNGVKLAGAWGQDPTRASAGNPALDAGTGIPPQPAFSAGKSAEVVDDPDGNGQASPGDTLLYSIIIRNDGRVPVLDVIGLVDTVPANTVYVVDSAEYYDSFNDTIYDIPDLPGFPLVAPGTNLGTLPVGKRFEVSFEVVIDDPLPPDVVTIVNRAIVSGGGQEIPAEVKTPLNAAGIALEKTVYLGDDNGASCPGSDQIVTENGESIVYCFAVTNTGETHLDPINIADPILGITTVDLTFVSGDPLPLMPGGARMYAYQTLSLGTTVLNEATATGTPTDDQGNPLTDENGNLLQPPVDLDTAEVQYTDVLPGIEIVKQANPTTVTEPGEDVTFTIVATNLSSEAGTLTSLDDDIHGDPTLITPSDCTLPQALEPAGQPGDSYSCQFTVFVGGVGGDSETDTVTGVVTDDDGNTASGRRLRHGRRLVPIAQHQGQEGSQDDELTGARWHRALQHRDHQSGREGGHDHLDHR